MRLTVVGRASRLERSRHTPGRRCSLSGMGCRESLQRSTDLDLSTELCGSFLIGLERACSYTSFNLSIATTTPLLHATSAPLSPTDTLNVTVTVTNTGTADGKTVAAIYFSKPLSKFVRCKYTSNHPWLNQAPESCFERLLGMTDHKMLGAFTKTPLVKAGGSTTVTLGQCTSNHSWTKHAPECLGLYFDRLVVMDSATDVGNERLRPESARSTRGAGRVHLDAWANIGAG